MRILLALALFLSGCLSDNKDDGGNTHGRTRWVRNINDSNVSALSCAADSQNYVVCAVLLDDVADFGQGDLGVLTETSLVVVKYGPTGSLVFARDYLGELSNSTGVHIAIDEDDDISLVIGNTGGTLDTGGEVPLSGSVFLKLSGTDGDILLSRPFDTTDEESTPVSVAVDGDGDALVVGVARALTDGEGGTLAEPGPKRLFLTKLASSDGAPRFVTYYGDADNEVLPHEVAATPTGDFIITGGFSGTLPFGTGIIEDAAERNYFVARFSDDDGAGLWAKAFVGALEVQEPLYAAVGPAGEVVVSGMYTDPADTTDDEILENSVTATKLDGNDGTVLWRSAAGSDEAELAPSGVSIDMDGYVVYGVNYSGVLTLSDVPWDSGDAWAFALLKLAPDDGSAFWTRTGGGGGGGDALAVEVDMDREGNVIMSGVLEKGEASALVRELWLLTLTP